MLARKTHFRSRKELAEAASTSVDAVKRAESGALKSLESWRKIVGALGGDIFLVLPGELKEHEEHALMGHGAFQMIPSDHERGDL